MPTTNKKEETNEIKKETSVKASHEKDKKEERYNSFVKAIKSVNKALIKKENKDKDSDPVISLLSDMDSVDVKRFSSGSFVLDTITGGGFPHGRVIEIYGPEASGKTSIALNSIANVQREGGNCVFIDAENALDTHYAKILGVDLSKIGFSQAAIAEDVINLCISLSRDGNTDLIVVDSVAALSPRAETEGGMDKQQMGALARVMSKGLRILTPICSQNNCTIIFLNQTRSKVGVMFGNPETTPGGSALKFYASQRIEVRRKEVIKDNNEKVGTRVRLKIVKNKVAAPFGEGYTVLTFAKGINHSAEIVVVGIEKNILYQKNSQSSLYYNPVNKDNEALKDIDIPTEMVKNVNNDNKEEAMYKLGRGQAAATEFLNEHPDLYKIIAGDIKTVLDNERNGIFTTTKSANSKNNKDDEEEEMKLEL